jgi:hypothetical protein
MRKTKIKIAFLAAEAEPYVKIGGLADVAGTLPLELRSLSKESPSRNGGNLELDIRLILPYMELSRGKTFRFIPSPPFQLFIKMEN